MKETKEQIRQRIEKERGEYTRKRRRKFLYLKHTNQMGNYYRQKIPIIQRLKPIVSSLKWWQRIYIVIVISFKRLWRKLFKSKV